MLYLRISWVSGQAGVRKFHWIACFVWELCFIVLGSGVVLLASFVTCITAISTCAICTNGDVKGGGAYFLVSCLYWLLIPQISIRIWSFSLDIKVPGTRVWRIYRSNLLCSKCCRSCHVHCWFFRNCQVQTIFFNITLSIRFRDVFVNYDIIIVDGEMWDVRIIGFGITLTIDLLVIMYLQSHVWFWWESSWLEHLSNPRCRWVF